jgi:hypothetical protein
MASAEVQQKFSRRGVALISPSQGPESLELELRKGSKEESEVVIGEGPWRKAVKYTHGDAVLDSELPLLQKNISIIKDDGFIEVSRSLDPRQDLYLQDHCLDAKPVLPAAMAIELMAESALIGWPEWNVSAIKDIRVFKGIVLDENAVDVRILTRLKDDIQRQPDEISLDVKIQNAQRPQLKHYGAAVVLRKTPAASSPYVNPARGDMDPFQTSTATAYEKWLFHGPRFQCLQQIEGISKTGMFATLIPSVPGECLSYAPQGQWLADPIVLDGGLQLALIWARIYLNITVLPSSFKAVHLFKPFYSTAAIHCNLQVLKEVNRQSVTYNMFYTNSDGDLLGMIEKVEATGSEALNRLTDSRTS